MMTVGHPTAAIAPQPHTSVVRNAGLPPISTVVLPITNGDDGICAGGGIGQVCKSPITAAGIPPINTVGSPGPVITPPWVVTSPTLAAAAIPVLFLIYLYNGAFEHSNCAR